MVRNLSRSLKQKTRGVHGHCAEGEHDPGDLIGPGFGGGSLEQAGAEHVIQGPVAPLVDGVALRMIG